MAVPKNKRITFERIYTGKTTVFELYDDSAAPVPVPDVQMPPIIDPRTMPKEQDNE